MKVTAKGYVNVFLILIVLLAVGGAVFLLNSQQSNSIDPNITPSNNQDRKSVV